MLPRVAFIASVSLAVIANARPFQARDASAAVVVNAVSPHKPLLKIKFSCHSPVYSRQPQMLYALPNIYSIPYNFTTHPIEFSCKFCTSYQFFKQFPVISPPSHMHRRYAPVLYVFLRLFITLFQTHFSRAQALAANAVRHQSF